MSRRAPVHFLQICLLLPLLVCVPTSSFATQQCDQQYDDEVLRARQGVTRFATFNVSLSRDRPGQLINDLKSGESADIAAITTIIQTVRPDVLLLNEFDYDREGKAAELLKTKYLNQAHKEIQPLHYPYFFSAASNTGVASGYDLNNDGTAGGPADAFGFGKFEGQYGMLLLSTRPIDAAAVRQFRHFQWADMPQSLLPVNYYDDEERKAFRLSSKSHWDVPVTLTGADGKTEIAVHVLASHPTPPVFDGPEDRNGRRNHDEIRFWVDYISSDYGEASGAGHYIYDDTGQHGGLKLQREADGFVLLGDLNADPVDGDSTRGAILQLLQHPAINAETVPASSGAISANQHQAGANLQHKGNPAYDTADFNDAKPGNLRVDYVLPSRQGLKVICASVFWPSPEQRENQPRDYPDSTTSDHRMVYMDVTLR